MREARLYTPLDGVVECGVCEHRCRVRPGKRGICGNYVNRDGRLYHLGYGRLSAVESRPIEIKPLFHYWPNSTALTFSNWGCNFHCPWCQNHHLSFRPPREDDPIVPPRALVETAIREGDQGVCASFNEPTTNFDYLVEVFSLATGEGLYSTMVTNCYLTGRALEELVRAGADGWSVDVKGCPGMRVLPHVDHEKVFRNARTLLDAGAHVEMVYLVVTGANDSEECYRWVIGRHLDLLGEEIPLHVNRYYPAHLWGEPPTPVERLMEIREHALREGIHYVYVGNVHDPEIELELELEATTCPNCGKKLIVRRGYRVIGFDLSREGGGYRCPRCGHPVSLRGRYVPGG